MDFVGAVNVLASSDERVTVKLNGDRGDVTIGGNGQSGAVAIRDFDGPNGMSLAALLNGARLRIRDAENRIPVELAAALNVAYLALGGSGFDGRIAVENAAGHQTIIVNGRDGDIVLRNDAGEQTIRLRADTGDVILSGADAAEDFEIVDHDGGVSAGTVMVLESSGKLRESCKAYDRRVAGVVSGAGDYRPGVILGRSQSTRSRRPIALAGKVYCKVDATAKSIQVGDLLTTSATPGHAMKAIDHMHAFGAVIGKALESLPRGQALIPILVALQ